jgi:hypothetical protein
LIGNLKNHYKNKKKWDQVKQKKLKKGLHKTEEIKEGIIHILHKQGNMLLLGKKTKKNLQIGTGESGKST